jgi:hypothetical protein
LWDEWLASNEASHEELTDAFMAFSTLRLIEELATVVLKQMDDLTSSNPEY